MKKINLLLAIIMLIHTAYGQTQKDSIKTKKLKEVIVKALKQIDSISLPGEQNAILYSGKKTEVINLSTINANISLKTGRQLFAKIPGVFVYDMDGSGNQLNISTRGLDSHRSWEFNVRQNNILINSDMYGYPASHYSAPMESIEKIELLRGTGSLQYGAQFGGMLNYVTKKPDSLKSVSFESINTAGSFNLLSSYNAVSGTHKKFSYYAYYYRRHSGGYRDNSKSDAEAQFVQLNYRFNPNFSLKAEIGRSKYLYQIPGPLTDSMFNTSPTSSTRTRNYYSPDIYVPSLTLNWRLSQQTKMILTTSGVFGNRSSVQFDAFANVLDNVSLVTGMYKNRQVDIDGFNSKTTEFRLLHQYSIGNLKSKLSTGIVYMNNDMSRLQQGVGTTGSDYDLSVSAQGFNRNLNFKTNNIAFSAENAFEINKRWVISPGIRVENGNSKMNGTIKYYTVNPLPTRIPHNFVLLGISSQFSLNKENTLYGGISQSYRPVIFKDIIPASTYEQIDKNLSDARGYNAEVGVRGRLFNQIQYDVNYFRVNYKNRFGTLVLEDGIGQPYIYRTNIGNSVTNGIELFLQYKMAMSNTTFISLFTSTSFMDAKYTLGTVSNGTNNQSIIGNKVEAVPQWIIRNGLEITGEKLSCTFLYNYTSSTFSDAANTRTPPRSGAIGFTPAYSILDFNSSLRVTSFLKVRAGISNILNKQYFTKRPTFYPGPGIWPSDGRNVYITMEIKI